MPMSLTPGRAPHVLLVPGLLGLLAVLGVLASPVAAGPAADLAAEHARLAEHLYAPPRPIPDGGITLRQGPATWTLERGEVRLQAPTADGALTGLVFVGAGRFQLELPAPGELDQLRRMAEDPALVGVDEPFATLVLRTAEPFLADAFPDAFPDAAAAPAGGGPSDVAAERHGHWLERWRDDVGARVVASLALPDDVYVRAGMESARFGWISYEHDGLADEEVRLARHHPGEDWVEDWVRFDRAADRREDGRSGGRESRLLDLRHLDATVDLTASAKRLGEVGLAGVFPRLGGFRVELTFMPRTGGGRALPLALDAVSRVTAVTDDDGTTLPFLRHQVDRTVSIVDFPRDQHDDDLVVLLDRPLVAGEERRVVVEYEREVLNYVPGGSWHPAELDPFRDPFTARLTLRTPPKYEVRAMGSLVAEREEGGARTTVWEIARPVRMVTFSFGDDFDEQTIAAEGGPEVVAFSSRGGPFGKAKTYNVAADVSNAVRYFTQLFAAPLPVERLYATAILGDHGQSFDGFLHLSEATFVSEPRGPSELFRAHEVAHQWWGHMVTWEGYRDQWLSEAFAQYSAMMFVEATMENGPELYQEIVDTYSGLARGHLGKMSPFIAHGFEDNDKHRRRIGPIAVGYRAATATSPTGYQVQNYVKGPLVLHMLRTMLRNLTKSDEVFLTVLRTFLATHRDEPASTADFVATLGRVAPGDWQWFFDQWIDGVAIPTYRYRWEVTKADGKTFLDLEVEQSDVPPGFRMPVPVRLDLGRGREGQVVILVDEPRETHRIELPERPRKVELDPGNAVLARVEKL